MEKKKTITIDNNTERVLEFDKVKRILADLATAEPGMELALAAEPFADPADVEQEHALLGELISLREIEQAVPIFGLEDIRTTIEVLQPQNSFLDPEEFWTVSRFCETVEHCKQFFRRHRDAAPNTFIKFNALESVKDVSWVIKQKIDPEGKVKDNASPQLRDLRKNIFHLQETLHRRMERFIKRFRSKAVLQDDFYTIRNDRYVLPVRSGSRKNVPGIIHGASKTGETLFIEPYDVVEESNELADLRIREANEVRRILIAVGDVIRRHYPAMLHNIALMASLDYLCARTELAVKYGMNIPEFGKGYGGSNQTLVLKKIHHPLLYVKERETSVPTEIRLREQDAVLVITGPNAGGKTTTLKTVGLNTLMFQSGIPVACAPDSKMEFFSNIYADIGDEQDVEQGLSTFTAHVRNISRILNEATAESLVLLDELGTATDPDEGAALGIAVLEDFSSKAALTITTSHLAGLKKWAHSHPRARNAAVKLDEKTGSPTYQLYMDVPGASEALIIARREGMHDNIIARARQVIEQDELDLSDLILSVQEKERALGERIERAEHDIEETDRVRAHYQKQIEEVERRRKHMKKEFLEEKERMLRAAANKIERMIADLPSRKEMSRARQEIKKDTREVEQQINKIEKQAKPVEKVLEEIKEQDVVYLPSFNQYGIVNTINTNAATAEIKIKNMNVRLPLSKLEPVPEDKKTLVVKELEDKVPGIKINVSNTAEYKLDLHGFTVEDALPIVDKFVDNAVVHNLPFVKIVHGHGSGRLMRGIHAFLKRHPHVKSYRFALPAEGGSAATIVHFE